MKKILLSISCCCLAAGMYAQELSHVIFSYGTTLSSFSFRTDQDIIIRISEEGKLLEWGTPWNLPGINPYPSRLQAYMGRVDYYGPEYDSISRGKVKSIGTCTITYYGPSESEARRGKIRSVGRATLDYYELYENTAFKGKLKTAGSHYLSYYAAYDNEAFRGKLKAVGTSAITYYSSFDDKNIRGKLKTIGTARFEWYTQTDSRGYPGSLKLGAQQQTITGVTYIIW